MPGQLVFPFGVTESLGRDDFIVAPSNEQAFAFIEAWPDWPVRAAAIWGPPQSGKSHLAAIWCARAGAQLLRVSGLGALDLSQYSPQQAFALEWDLPACDLKCERTLLGLFERPNGALLFTARAHPSEWKASIGDLKSRFNALLAFQVLAPDDALLAGLVRKHFSDRQLEVEDPVVARLLTHLERTPEAIAHFISRLDETALSERRPISERLVLELIGSK